ncbi:hypothetical protein CGC58_03335 [Capnocytophaga stomatis]|uniref:GmrSD restriction endonucleases N-terminal domain-containing protein n=1 Tax=Capnocytophaga stomatis TaxID=1848904 RepID=A0A250FUK8_9FLAO|nr:DUF262 domain-containing protein [Capnocytophaga stomatis]ATA88842.1 hypothetical protein CGC58_03335 [Capnocytophaga stomatis]
MENLIINENNTETNKYEGDYDENESSASISEYDITVSPNDFNLGTIFNFIEKGVFKIPGFQRNYVWDIKRASKLIESLLMNIPIPQIFLYEEGKNNFLVIDGQQRLMSIYYFMKERFPKRDKRVELRKIFEENSKIPDEILYNNEYFIDFNLNLPEQLPDNPNKFNKKNYSTLEDTDKTALELKTIRNIIIRSNKENNHSVEFEIFNRLNTGGVNLKPQEIRTSLYHSKFYDMLYKINSSENWRSLLKNPTPNINMKEVEILLRGFAMLVNKNNYRPSMTKFLNIFSYEAKSFEKNKIDLLEKIFNKFIEFCVNLKDENLFFTSNNRFNISVYEAIFSTLCENAYQNEDENSISNTSLEKINRLKKDEDFIRASSYNTSSKKNVDERNRIAKQILLSDGE